MVQTLSLSVLSPEAITALLAALGVSFFVPVLGWLQKRREDEQLRQDRQRAEAQERQDEDVSRSLSQMQGQVDEYGRRIKSLERQVEFLTTGAVNDLPVPLYYLNKSGHFEWVNRSFVTLLFPHSGKSIDDIIGLRYCEVLSPKSCIIIDELNSIIDKHPASEGYRASTTSDSFEGCESSVVVYGGKVNVGGVTWLRYGIIMPFPGGVPSGRG